MNNEVERLKKVAEKRKEEQARIWAVEDEKKAISKRNDILQHQLDNERRSQEHRQRERSDIENRLKQQVDRLTQTERNLENKSKDLKTAINNKKC